MSEREALERRAAVNLTLGYVTKDSCPGVGDDTPHTALPFFETPDYVVAPLHSGVDPTAPVLDFVFDDFILSDVISILNTVQNTTKFTEADAALYSPTLLDAVLGVFAQQAWN